ncbi:hypothetical protein BZL29_3180 [Mycobacterium kansasii]|uniref:Uncharacterized protein n=1 Tax=Mycobacterium kansasii TaxID=1768 RepID=A0A1V3XDM0_MYCKA|nr:hypothetical protein BZL29_3180 [Mycobacterium kansasii]
MDIGVRGGAGRRRATLFALGIIAEYIAASATMAMGKPVYVIVRDPGDTFDNPAD